MIKKFYKKRRNVSDLVTNSVHDTKTAEIKNKIPDLRDLIKKTNYNAKISGFEEKYFTASDYKKFTSDILNAKIRKKELVNTSNIFSLLKNLG